jgi:DNA-binding NarL/FixJ family response regulator
MDNQTKLTPREIEVIQLIADGFTDAEIADKLNISPKTASTHRKNILRKLNLKNAAMITRYALENKIIK